MRRILLAAVAASVVLGMTATVAAQGTRRPPLFFSEAWVSTRGDSDEIPLTQKNVTNPNLVLHAFGAMEISGQNAKDDANPPHTYNGLCNTACGITLSKTGFYADLTGTARVRLNTKMSGFHVIRPLIKLADGTYLIGDHATGVIGPDYLISEFNTGDLRWINFDPKRLITVGRFLDKVDLTKVEEVGYIDLIPGSGHGQGGWSDVGLFELYANASPR
jgi:hypothetical protein